MSYFVLAVILALLGYFYLYFPVWRFGVTLVMGIVYFGWGIYRHWLDKSLHRSIVLEYLVLALLGMSLLYFLNFRA